MRRQMHLEELEHKATQLHYKAEKQNEREVSVAAAWRSGSTHTDRVRERALERKAKKEFESGVVGLHGVPFQP